MPLDIGIGLLLGAAVSSLTGLNYESSLCLGVVACLLPDLDFVWPLIKNKHAPTGVHRDGLHYPLLFIPVVGLLGLLVGPSIGLIFALGALAHFIHDSIGVGWGVKWLYPFKNVSYAFLYIVSLPSNKYMPRHWFYHWNDTERARASKKYGEPQWIKHIYFQAHPFGLIEYAVLILGILFAITQSP